MVVQSRWTITLRSTAAVTKPDLIVSHSPHLVHNLEISEFGNSLRTSCHDTITSSDRDANVIRAKPRDEKLFAFAGDISLAWAIGPVLACLT
jgi:hypothetical protein